MVIPIWDFLHPANHTVVFHGDLEVRWQASYGQGSQNQSGVSRWGEG